MSWIINQLRHTIAIVDGMTTESACINDYTYVLDADAWQRAYDHLSTYVNTSALDWAFGVLGTNVDMFNAQPLENRIVCIRYIGE